MLNGISFAALALPLQVAETIPAQAFAVAIIVAIAATLIYYGNKYRKKAKAEAAAQAS